MVRRSVGFVADPEGLEDRLRDDFGEGERLWPVFFWVGLLTPVEEAGWSPCACQIQTVGRCKIVVRIQDTASTALVDQAQYQIFESNPIQPSSFQWDRQA